MRILLFGYGKMGKTIEQIAQERGHEVPYKIDINNLEDIKTVIWPQVDVAIEFTQPTSAVGNIETALRNNVPVLSGTTGWLEDWGRVERVCGEVGGTFFYASNFSIGVNIFFQLNRILAQLMNNVSQDYDIAIEEIHHTEKKDTPSGTAITLANGVIDHFDSKRRWVNVPSKDKEDLVITSKREGIVPGTHTVTYTSPVDNIELQHTAHGRQGFASGAVSVAEWISTGNQKGILGMNDYLESQLGETWSRFASHGTS